MTQTYRVNAPYVVLKTQDRESGRSKVNGYYEGAIVTGPIVDEASLAKHLERGWIEEIQPAADNPDEPVAEEPDKPAADSVPSLTKPGQADQKAAWVDYAESTGIDRAEAEAMTKADLIDLLK
jgi:hypothetical protein